MAYILREVTRALSYLHGHHRIHRDVKGTNILFTKERLMKGNSVPSKTGGFMLIVKY